MMLIGPFQQSSRHEQTGIIVTHHSATNAGVMLAGIVEKLIAQVAEYTGAPVTGMDGHGFT